MRIYNCSSVAKILFELRILYGYLEDMFLTCKCLIIHGQHVTLMTKDYDHFLRNQDENIRVVVLDKILETPVAYMYLAFLYMMLINEDQVLKFC